MNLVSVLCDAPGFRRAGRAWPAESVVDMDDFSLAEQQAIEGEAQLQVRVLSKKEQAAHLEARGVVEPPKTRKRAARKTS